MDYVLHLEEITIKEYIIIVVIINHKAQKKRKGEKNKNSV